MTPAYRPGRRSRPLRLGPSAPEARGQTHRSLQAPSHASSTPRASVGTEPAPPWDPTFTLSLQTGGVFRGRGVAGSEGGLWHIQSWLSACAALHARGLSGAGTRACAGGQARGLRALPDASLAPERALGAFRSPQGPAGPHAGEVGWQAAPHAGGRWGRTPDTLHGHKRGGRELRGLLAGDMEGTRRSLGASRSEAVSRAVP